MHHSLGEAALETESVRIQQAVRFGRDFELEPDLYELRRSGRVLRLERIPMNILLLLVKERERVVERQEIADTIWGKGICLDADNSINGAIRKIRHALKDNPEDPRFIQTVTGRGYRFVAPVTIDEAKKVAVVESEAPKMAPEPIVSTVTEGALAVDSAESVPVLEKKASRRSHFHWRPVLVVAAAVLLIVLSLFAGWRRTVRAESSYGELHLAVMPFQNLTGDAGQEYFSDGFTEEMITQLGSLDPQRLAVIARTSIMHYKDTQTPLPQIGRDLGVQYILEGSVRRDADKVRITAQLIQVCDQTHVWVREYDRAPNDVLAVQSEIAREIADEIELKLDGKPVVANAQMSLTPREYEAYDSYLKGRYLWSQRTKEGFQGSVYWFKEAIARDPDDARGYAGLADAYTLMSAYGDGSPDVYMPQARAAALKALQLDDSLAEAHTSLALIAENYDWDWKTAEKEYRRAIQLNPNYATAHHWLAECLAYQGRFDEALKESEQARGLDPLSLIITTDNGAIYYFSRQYDRAIERFQGVLDVDPSFGRAHMIIGAYVAQGRYRDALAVIEQWHRIAGDKPWISDWEVYVYGRMGDSVRARQLLQQMERAKRTMSPDRAPIYVAAYAGIGDKEKLLASLQEYYRRHTNLPTSFKVDPMFDTLRSDPRFQELLRGTGFDS
jgi:TolB-like protein/DNA-binding winged helix-turn-helix (wHTH) protein